MQEAGESRSDVRRPGVRTRDVRRAEMDGDDPDGWGRSQYPEQRCDVAAARHLGLGERVDMPAARQGVDGDSIEEFAVGEGVVGAELENRR